MNKKQQDKNVIYFIVAGLVLLVIVAFGVGLLGFVIATQLQNQNNIKDVSIVDVSSQCITSGGTWISSSKECENISEPQCRDLSGAYNACASVCRNLSGESICTQNCVQVCTFK
ncbi:MAG: hypothetical protein ABI721_02970 [Candidatus Dojkabacteria bacterium]